MSNITIESSTTAVEALVPWSRAILTRNWIPSLVFGFLGIIGIVNNVIILVVVFRGRLTKKAHHYVCMQTLAAVDAFTGVVATCVGFKRFSLFASGGVEISTTWRCMVDLYPLELSITLSMVCTLLMAIDRLFGVAAPLTYKGIDPKKMRIAHYVVCALYILYISIALGGAGEWPGELVPACLFGLVFVEGWSQLFETYTGLALECLVLVVYVVLLVVMAARHRQQAALGDDSDLNLRVAKTTAFIVAVFVLTFTNADVIDTVLVYVDGDAVPYFGPWYLCMQYLSCCLNLPVYVWKNKQFREQLKKMGGKASSVKTLKVKPMAKGVAGQIK